MAFLKKGVSCAAHRFCKKVRFYEGLEVMLLTNRSLYMGLTEPPYKRERLATNLKFHSTGTLPIPLVITLLIYPITFYITRILIFNGYRISIEHSVEVLHPSQTLPRWMIPRPV